MESALVFVLAALPGLFITWMAVTAFIRPVERWKQRRYRWIVDFAGVGRDGTPSSAVIRRLRLLVVADRARIDRGGRRGSVRQLERFRRSL